jgi:uncharacterized protein YukE
VELDKFDDVVAATKADKQLILEGFEEIKTKITTINTNWDSPAAIKYEAFTEDINSVAKTFAALFESAVTRLETAYINYTTTEYQNYQNLQPPPPHNQWTRPPP